MYSTSKHIINLCAQFNGTSRAQLLIKELLNSEAIGNSFDE